MSAQMASEIRKSGMLRHLMFWLPFLAAASLWLTARDFMTNYYGMRDAELFINATTGINRQATRIALAVAVQGLATVATYTAFLIVPNNDAKRKVRNVVIAIAIAAVLFDVWFGYLHYIHPDAAVLSIFDGANWNDDLTRTYFTHALVHSFIVDTILSELLSSWSIGLIYNLRQDYRETARDLRGAYESMQDGEPFTSQYGRDRGQSRLQPKRKPKRRGN